MHGRVTEETPPLLVTVAGLKNDPGDSFRQSSLPYTSVFIWIIAVPLHSAMSTPISDFAILITYVVGSL